MKKVVVITGASGGIGYETALLFAGEFIVYNLSRSSGGQEDVIHIETDISDEMSVKNAFARIKLEQGRVDILINNAGFGISGAVEYTETADAKRLFDVNFFGMFLCCKYAAPMLREAHGRIINVSSVAAVFPIPFQSFYSASKAAVNSFTCALRNEMGLFGVSVCALMPGDTRTGFTSSREKSENGESVYRGKIGNSVARMERDEEKGMPPINVAKDIYRVARKKRVRPLYVSGTIYRLYGVLLRLLPGSSVNFILRKLYI